MAISIDKLVEVRRISINEQVKEILRQLIIDGLSTKERMIYDFVASQKSVTSRDIANEFNLSINRVGNMLNHLRKLDLVTSMPKTGPDGLHYEWMKGN